MGRGTCSLRLHTVDGGHPEPEPSLDRPAGAEVILGSLIFGEAQSATTTTWNYLHPD